MTCVRIRGRVFGVDMRYDMCAHQRTCVWGGDAL